MTPYQALSSLKALDAQAQIGLLFLIVFGVLSIVTAGTVFMALREQTAGRLRALRRFVADLRAVWVGAVVFWLAWITGATGATLLFGVFSFLALREFVTLMQTHRADHRSLMLAFFVVLPLQYVLVGSRSFDLFTVFIPVYVFFALPVLSALGGDPLRFLERNAGLQWGVMVCVFGLSHAPALLLLDFPGAADRGPFLVFFLVIVTACAQIFETIVSQRLPRRPVARAIDRTFGLRAWLVANLGAAIVGGLLFWITPFKLPQAMVMAFVAGGAGTLGELVMAALKKDAGVSYWGNAGGVTGAVGLLDRVSALCFAAPVFFHSVRWYFQLRP
ncbi:MAG TPA: phosphatidate cytidylyltransferase [Burkholderiaceae bacterium]|jgi:phosphatidate cytidylyltransferase|nr:phosphatidate cytidylyltransferase [Burkholderiaceae bacterium]